MGSFLDITCLPNDDCHGTEEDYQMVLIHKHGNNDAHPGALITWKGRACASRPKGNHASPRAQPNKSLHARRESVFVINFD
jgi:hypothetical protein